MKNLDKLKKDLLTDKTTGQLLKQLCGIMKPDKGAIKRVWGKSPVEFIVGIDKDHTAYITMSQEDYLALLSL